MGLCFQSVLLPEIFPWDFKMLLFRIGVPRSNGCEGKMKRDEGSVIKEQPSAEGGLVCLLPPTYPPSDPHVFSFSPFVVETFDFGYQPEDSWQLTRTLSQLNLVGAILSLKEPV